jgi:hypothetical protein
MWVMTGALLALAACSGKVETAAVQTPDLFKVTTGTSPVGDRLDARLVSPHYTLIFDSVLVADKLSATVAQAVELGDGPVAAANGQEFVIASLSSGRALWTDGIGDTQTEDLSATIVIGERTEELTELPKEGTTVTVSVPKDVAVTLNVKDAGRTQSISLRDGKPGEDVVKGFDEIPSGSLDVKYEKTGNAASTGFQRPLEVSVRANKASRQPWTPQTGWANSNRSWLYIDGVSISSDGGSFDRNKFPAEFKLDLKKSFTLFLLDGSPVTPTNGGTVNTYVPAVSSHAVIFEVPPDFTTGKLRIAPVGQITARWREGNQPGSWTKMPSPQDYEITLK